MIETATKAERNASLFTQARDETATRRTDLKKAIFKLHNEALTLWNNEFRNERLEHAHSKDFKRFLKLSIKHLELTGKTDLAFHEYLLTLSGILGRPSFRRIVLESKATRSLV